MYLVNLQGILLLCLLLGFFVIVGGFCFVSETFKEEWKQDHN